MPLTPAQRAELEEHGATSIRFKLTQYGAGRGADISGFKSGIITRGDIEDWLAEEAQREQVQQALTLRWAQIAAGRGSSAHCWRRSVSLSLGSGDVAAQPVERRQYIETMSPKSKSETLFRPTNLIPISTPS